MAATGLSRAAGNQPKMPTKNSLNDSNLAQRITYRYLIYLHCVVTKVIYYHHLPKVRTGT